MIHFSKYIFLLFFTLSLAQFGFSQKLIKPQLIEQDSSETNTVIVDFSDYAEGSIENGKSIRILHGNVELRQDSTFMYCDSATIIDNNVFAHGNIIIQQKDSVSVFADSISFDGDNRIADFFGDVILLHGEQKLFTNQLKYDLNKKMASYYNGATLTNKNTQLSSKKGYYFTETKDAFFKDSVIVVDSSFNLRADTLQYNTDSRVVSFLGPTLIHQKESEIYCEGGFYDTRNKLAEFTQNAQYQKEEQKATADKINYDGNKKEIVLTGQAKFEEGEKVATANTITYNEKTDITILNGDAHFVDKAQDIIADFIEYDSKQDAFSTKGRSTISDPPQILMADQVDFDTETEMGIATGNVFWRDTSANMSIRCEQAEYNKNTDYFKAFGGRPLLTTLLDGDTMFMTSDTLISVKADTSTLDSSRLLLAFADVRILKTDFQAVCDSLSYNTKDSIFQFFDEPIVWSDTSQFTADTMHIIMSDGQIDTIYLYEKGFIINSPDEKFFNQIKGKNIIAFFADNELRKMKVEGNAESVYYALDEDKAYIGVNKTACSEMLLYFGNNEVEKIKFFAQPKAKLQPMKQADHNALKLNGFKWETKRRPKVFKDLFDNPKLEKPIE
ncbi:MAG TPA: hypothetical protein ENK52_02015 [Saprospiraceae bacterium]|nr:hypothetical protein [Saprospiraceae bacterium]